MLMIITLFVTLILDKNYVTVSCSKSKTFSLQRSDLYTGLYQEIYCREYHKKVRYSLECAIMCLKHKSLARNDEFLNTQAACTLFAYNESSTSGTNCMLCLLSNIEESYEVNRGPIIADYVFLNSNPVTGKYYKPITSEFWKTKKIYIQVQEIFLLIQEKWRERKEKGLEILLSGIYIPKEFGKKD